MEITKGRLEEFQKAYGQDFGEGISPEEAREMLSRLATFYGPLLRPLPSNDDRQETAKDCAFDSNGSFAILKRRKR
ncbi:MAG: hypothetical protein MN733_34795 [Nitrososphaera sp.]|nr:hypothetical protein [Nitrososphaera sp.]